MAVTWKFILTVVITVVGASFQFYSFAVLNTTQQTIEQWINATYAKRNGRGSTPAGMTLFWSFVVSILPVGGIVGSILTKTFAERLGRRNGLVANGVLNVVGGICEGTSKLVESPELLIVGRFILGINIGLSCGLAPLYLTEIAPIRLRGAVGTTHQIAAAFGDWFCMLISLPIFLGGEDLWPIALAFPALPAFLLCIVLPFCPESPRYLMLTMGDRIGTKLALEQLVGTGTDALIMLDDLERESQWKVPSLSFKWTVWFKHPELHRPLLISAFVMVAQASTAIAAILSFSSEIFTQAGLSLNDAQLATVGVGACYFLCTVPALWLIEYVGRRSLALFQLAGCALCLALLSLLIGCTKIFPTTTTLSIGFSYAAIGTLILYMCVYGVGSPIPWLITSELFSQNYRSAAVAMATSLSFFGGFIVSIVYLPLQEAVGASFSFLPFVGVLIICIVGLTVFLPETRNKRIEDIVAAFRLKGELQKNFSNGLVAKKNGFTYETAPLIIDDGVAHNHLADNYGAVSVCTDAQLF